MQCLFTMVVSLLAIGHALFAQELVVYTMPAPKNINWSAPNALFKSCIVNKVIHSPYGSDRHPIGHMLVGLSDATRFDIVGMTIADDEPFVYNTLFKGYGMGILFSVLKGKLEAKDVNEPQIQQRLKNGDIAFVKYKVNQKGFDRMWNYLQEFKEKGYDKIYNGCNSPREGGGSGCSAFVQSFLEIGGIAHFLPAKEWEINVKVPETCIGGPEGNQKHVGIFKLLRAKSWVTSPLEPYRRLSILDPTLFFHWLQNNYKTFANNTTIFAVTEGKAIGLLIDCSHIIPPEEPFWVSKE